MTSRTFTFAELHKSHLNVRTNEKDSHATKALADSIHRRGLLQPISVHATGPDAPTLWGVFAGGRRLHAIGQLIDAGKLPADWPIPATILDATDAEIIEMSLGENILRVGLRPYEVHTAVAEAFDRGDSVATIAANLGQSEEWVAKELRLGQLARPIFEAYAIGELSYEHAAAYAATADNELQLMVFASFAGAAPVYHTPAKIRAALKVGDGEASRLLLFVGEAVYVGRGGAIEHDLFSDGPVARVRVTNEDLLRTLADERMAGERDRFREAVKRPELRFVKQPPQYMGRTDEALEIRDAPLPKGDIVATIDVDEFGQPATRCWWASRSAKGATAKGKADAPAPVADTSKMVPSAGEALVMPDSAYASNGRAIAKDEYGLSADQLQIVRSLRRDLLRCLLIDQGGEVARDYLIWAQARSLVGQQLPAQTGCRAIVGEWNDGADRPPPGLYEDYAGDTAATVEWRSWHDGLKAQPFMAETDSAKSLELYLSLSAVEKNNTAAIVAGVALLRSAETPGFRIAAHDVLARACGADAGKLRRWWTPTVKWLGLFGRMFRLGVVQTFVDADTHARFIKLPDRELTDALAIALEPERHHAPDVRALAARWLPDLLAFGPDEGAPLAEALDLEEGPVDEARVKVKASLRAKAQKLREQEGARSSAAEAVS